MGAEFTATSMIGWIALAGIIVRNSILLVDFSIHEVQRGVPVREAVIRACKTRTRPIMITALALVAGSSVIFTDPIFQGMAISLASGVMVSTILTLVVIPLGCIKAERALCEVAAAGCAAAGIPVPEEIVVPVAAPAQPRQASSGGGLLLTVWSKVAGALLMVFYAVRGLFLLLGSMFKKKAPAARPAPAAPPSPPAAPAVPAVPAGEDAAPSRRAEAMVSSGPGVTRVISPAKNTIVPPPPAHVPVEPASLPPEPSAQSRKKPAGAAPAAKPGKVAASAQAVAPETQAQPQARAKVSARRGIRLKLIKPTDDESGLK
jgi:hypothetical protein